MRYSELFAAHLEQLPPGELPTAVEVLIENAFVISRTQFWIRKNEVVDDAAGLRRFRRNFRRLLAHEPLAYIIKEKEFFGATFVVSPAVLVPRPETELLVEKALALLGQGTSRVLDIGAGSGNIAIVLALRSQATVTALEASLPALRVLKKNIARFGLQEKVIPLRGDLFPKKCDLFDMIAANPPYLSEKEWRGLPPGIKRYEPRRALVAGRKGTETLERIVDGAASRLQNGAHLLLEIGQGQRRAVSGFLKDAGLRESGCIRDYAGIERVIIAQKD